jgi:hypothetical protein
MPARNSDAVAVHYVFKDPRVGLSPEYAMLEFLQAVTGIF